MLCAKCQLLATSGDNGHADLVHKKTVFNDPALTSWIDARTDTYQCRTCEARWETTYDPAVSPHYGVFRRLS